MAMMVASMGPLLRKAESLIGSKQFDPLLLLTLVMDDGVLQQQTLFGQKMLTDLQTIVSDKDERQKLLEEAREYARDHLSEELQWRLASQRMPSMQIKVRKNDLLNQQNEMCIGSLAPTLVQFVERFEKRRHCLVGKYVDVLHMEMLNLLLEEEELPSSCRFGGVPRPMQVIEFPNIYQRVLKFYVDWDKKLSEATTLVSRDGMQREQVEKIRQAALQTPAALMRILSTSANNLFADGTDSVIVLVKEGTRKIQPSQGCPADWKISFHFVFQMLLTIDQFRAVYQQVSTHILKCPEKQMLAACLLKSPCPQTCTMLPEEMASEIISSGSWWSGLIGVDLHPRQNAFQGLACLGSRKKETYPPSFVLGRMKVSTDGSSWGWEQQQCLTTENAKFHIDTSSEWSLNEASNASTLQAVPNEQAGSAGPLTLKDRIGVWVEASILIPSPTCIAINHGSSLLDKTFTNTMAMASEGSRKRRDTAPMEAPGKKPLWKELLLESAGLRWFREGFGGAEETGRLFSQAYTNIQNISKPKEVSDAAKGATAGKCPPWALVHISSTDACMCSLSMMQVPFKGHKRHQRNGVVYCLFGSRVFVSCMDAECKDAIRERGRVSYALAKELERIYLGHYNTQYLSERYAGDVSRILLQFSEEQDADQKDQDDILHPYVKALAKISKTRERDAEFLCSEAAKVSVGCSPKEKLRNLSNVRMVSADSILESASGERVWIEITRETLQSYVSWLKNPHSSSKMPPAGVSEQQQQQRRHQHAVLFARGPPLLFQGLGASRMSLKRK